MAATPKSTPAKAPRRQVRQNYEDSSAFLIRSIAIVLSYLVGLAAMWYFNAPIWLRYAWASQRFWTLKGALKTRAALWERPGAPMLTRIIWFAVDMCLVAGVAFTATQALQEFSIARGTTISQQVRAFRAKYFGK